MTIMNSAVKTNRTKTNKTTEQKTVKVKCRWDSDGCFGAVLMQLGPMHDGKDYLFWFDGPNDPGWEAGDVIKADEYYAKASRAYKNRQYRSDDDIPDDFCIPL